MGLGEGTAPALGELTLSAQLVATADGCRALRPNRLTFPRACGALVEPIEVTCAGHVLAFVSMPPYAPSLVEYSLSRCALKAGQKFAVRLRNLSTEPLAVRACLVGDGLYE